MAPFTPRKHRAYGYERCPDDETENTPRLLRRLRHGGARADSQRRAEVAAATPSLLAELRCQESPFPAPPIRREKCREAAEVAEVNLRLP